MRSLSKEILDAISENLELLLSKVMKSNEVGFEMEKFSLKIALKRFQSPIVEKRINGISVINEKAAHLRRSQYPSYSINKANLWLGNAESMVSWLEENRVFESIFEDIEKSHVEIIKRSSDIVKLYTTENRLSEQKLDMMWKLIECCMIKSFDYKLLEALYKVIDEISYNVDTKLLFKLIENISKIPLNFYQASTLEFLKEFARLPTKYGTELTNLTLDLFLRIIISDTQGNNSSYIELQQVALSKFEDLLRISIENSTKLIFLDKCINNIKNHTCVPQSLKMLQKLVNSFSDRLYSENMNKTTAITYLEDTYKATDLIIDDMCFSRERTSELDPFSTNIIENSLKCRLDVLMLFFISGVKI
jgi:hypothetical protein